MKQMIWCMVGVLVLASTAFAWAVNQPTPPADNIYVKPGTPSSVCESAQNMVGGEDVVLQLEVLQGSDIASFNGKSSMQLSVPFGELDVKWCLNVKSPSTARDVIVKVSKRTETQGTVTFSTAQLATLHIIPSAAPVETVQPAVPGPEVKNESATVQNASVPISLKAAGNDKAWLYVLLGVGAFVVTGGIGLLYRQDVLTI